jgi:hypothetical protein
MRTEFLFDRDDHGIDVVVLFAPRSGPLDDFETWVTEWQGLGRAVLVVLPDMVDADSLDRLASAGADLCVERGHPTELFTDMERARRLHRLRDDALREPAEQIDLLV